MKERPILFNTDMVQAILAGRKTQTRRVINPQPHPEFLKRGVHSVVPQWPMQDGIRWFMKDGCSELVKSAVGKPGDRLWVRETFQGPLIDQGGDYPNGYEKPEFCVYAADGVPRPEFTTVDDETVCRWRPSIHMPRWACRIILEITSVRVERLQDISEADAVAEGFDIPEAPGQGWKFNAKHNFKFQWDLIYKNWKENPWVWVLEFKVLTTNGKVQEVAA